MWCISATKITFNGLIWGKTYRKHHVFAKHRGRCSRQPIPKTSEATPSTVNKAEIWDGTKHSISKHETEPHIWSQTSDNFRWKPKTLSTYKNCNSEENMFLLGRPFLVQLILPTSSSASFRRASAARCGEPWEHHGRDFPPVIAIAAMSKAQIVQNYPMAIISHIYIIYIIYIYIIY